MRVDDLSMQEVEAVKRILDYWTRHWDWECQTLFGLELREVQSVAKAWPEIVHSQSTALAVLGSMREFLYGASSVSKGQVVAECGISFEASCALLDRLFPRIEAALGGTGDAL